MDVRAITNSNVGQVPRIDFPRPTGGEGPVEVRDRIPDNAAFQSQVFKEKEYSEEDLQQAVDKVNKQVVAFDRHFEISVHDATNRIMVKVVDSTNNELIREIPPEKFLDMVAKFCELAGLAVDKRV
ncbi:MAG: flagellar protein FlaG [Tissierellia bacterium]|nr:flagellar protein FlaG [Tissierellia bacterium]